MKRYYHQELSTFRSHIVQIAEKASELTRLSMRVLEDGEVGLCEEIFKKDDVLDDLEIQIDAEAVRYISLRAPVASELRLVTVGMKAGHDLERIGDEAVSIAKRAKKVHLTMPPQTLKHIPAMAEIALDMLKDAIGSLFAENCDEANTIGICKRDKQVDGMHKENTEYWMQQILEKPQTAPVAVELLFISKSLERIADHACNLAEEVLFLNSGEDIRHSKTIKKNVLNSGDQ